MVELWFFSLVFPFMTWEHANKFTMLEECLIAGQRYAPPPHDTLDWFCYDTRDGKVYR